MLRLVDIYVEGTGKNIDIMSVGKVFLICLILQPAQTFNLTIQPSHHVNLAFAVKRVVAKVFAKDMRVANLLCENESKNPIVKDFQDDFLKFDQFDIAFRQEKIEKMKLLHRPRFFTIITVEDFPQFQRVYAKLSADLIAIDGYSIVVCIKCELPIVEKMFEILWRLDMYNVLIIHETDNGIIQLKTFLPFKPGKCEDLSPVIINQYQNEKFELNNDNFFPNKMKNLHGCSIRAAIEHERKPYIATKKLPNGSYEMSGSDIKLINSLAEILNFRINYTFIGNSGNLYDNGTVDGCLGALVKKTADFSPGNLLMSDHRMKYLSSTTAYTSFEFYFVVPPGRDLTSFEVLIYPLSLSLWIAVGMCFLVGIFVITFVKFYSERVQEIVFGRGVRYQYLNIFSGFLGGSQPVLPDQNFSRCLLMSFLMYSLVVRTVYQGAFFNLLQSNKRTQEIQSINEMLQKDFNFYITVQIYEQVKGVAAIQKK